jgi:hypothetical protein
MILNSIVLLKHLLIELMHSIEPFHGWRDLYTSENDVDSPFYGREHSEFYFTDQIYDHYIHPQWDNMESDTLFIKILYVHSNEGYAIIELMGEWNDALYNDIMFLKRNVIEDLINIGVNKFILLGENIMNFHYSDDSYYEEWFEEVEDGWIATLNFRDHVMQEMQEIGLDQYFISGGEIEKIEWRTLSPIQFYEKISRLIKKRLN